VLQDLNFSVKAGEALGIIGINGAGKSTLLKMVVGTLQPTTGKVEMQGARHCLSWEWVYPDFTGRQNVFMAAQLLGMSAEEVSGLMPGIEAFAEIGEYIDHPVRVYLQRHAGAVWHLPWQRRAGRIS
jgi:lipopolysaccharide transport system ATP-binding protein